MSAEAVLRAALVAASVGAVAGCATTETVGSPGALSSTIPSSSVPASECPAVDLRSPDGMVVNLTGVWSFNGIWAVTQTGSCVAIEGVSDWPGEENGSRWRAIFSGNLRSDLTIVGRWTWTYTRDAPRNGTYQQTLFVLFEEGVAAIGSPATLFGLDVYGNPQPEAWTRISADTAIPD